MGLSFCKFINSKALCRLRYISRLGVAQRLSQLLIIILIEMSCENFSPVQSNAVISCLQKRMKKNGFNLKVRAFRKAEKNLELETPPIHWQRIVWMNRREMEIKLFHVPKHQLCDEDVYNERTGEVFILTSIESMKNA